MATRSASQDSVALVAIAQALSDFEAAPSPIPSLP